MNRNTAAVVVTYNRAELLEKCIHCLLAQTVECDILIVNNASTDSTESVVGSFLCQNPETVFAKNTGSNLGGAGGFNYGIRWAAESGYRYLWIMDDDCMPAEDALDKLLIADTRLKGSYGWLSSKCLWTDGSICRMNIQRSSPYRKIVDFSENIIPATMATFVSLLIKSETVDKYGLPIKDFFIWSDDWEYTRRISLAEPCYAVSDSIVTHCMKNNCGSNIATDSLDKMDRYRFAFRNEHYVFRREGLCGILYYFAKVIKNLTVILLKSDNKAVRLKSLFFAVKDAYLFKPKIEKIILSGRERLHYD